MPLKAHSLVINDQTQTISILIEGSISGWIGFKLDSEGFALLHSFYILPSNRNKGYGKLLFKYTLDFLANNNFKQIFLIPEPYEIQQLSLNETDYFLEKLLGFYSNFGFIFLNNSDEAEKLLKSFNFLGKSHLLMYKNF